MNKMTKSDYKKAHEHSYKNRQEILASAQCGCFFCLAVYPPSEVNDWNFENAEGIGHTAICPKCGIDSVIGDLSGYPVTDKKFMKGLKKFSFW